MKCVICKLIFVAAILSLTACSSAGPSSQGRTLTGELDGAAAAFFDDLAAQGVSAQAYYTLFVPENTVNRRHIVRFRSALERALRKTSVRANLQFNASADRVFFLSEHKPEGWTTPQGGRTASHELARQFKNGTAAGWTALHAFWGQVNRLLIGDASWIQDLPDSIRADLSHPLTYVLRVSVWLDATPDAATAVHEITFDFVEVGKERTLFSKSYPLVLTFPLP